MARELNFVGLDLGDVRHHVCVSILPTVDILRDVVRRFTTAQDVKELSHRLGLVLNPAMRQTPPLAWPSMHRTLLKFAVVVVVGTWTMGCVPMRYTSGPATKGQVVDANTLAPIPNAFVTLTRSKGAAAQETTSGEGNFHIGSRHRWYMLNLFHPSKPILQPAILTVDAGSYLSFATNSPPGAKMLNVGIIQLQPLPK